MTACSLMDHDLNIHIGVTVLFPCSYLALHFSELSSELGLQRVRQLVVNWTCQLLLDSLFIQNLEDTEVMKI